MKKSQIYTQEDMLEEIFLRLPVKSLIRFRCVCKSWHQIIGTSTFIRATISNTNNLYLLSTYKDLYSLNRVDGVTDDKNICYTPELFGIDQNYSSGIKVYGSCNGLLCVSDTLLHLNSDIYLCNPIIRKVKKIPRIPIEVHDPKEDEPMENAKLFFGHYADEAQLSFGYFDDDYKVIRMAEFSGMYRIGVYSLSVNCWKIIYCASDHGTFKLNYTYPSSNCVNGVAYFVKYEGRLVCFDLHNERIREVNFPETIKLYCSKLEAYGESIAIVEISVKRMVKWELKFCDATKMSTWEKKVIIELQSGVFLHSIGFMIDGRYLLRDYMYSDDFYLCDLDLSLLEKYTCDAVSKTALTINYLVGNLVLLPEKNLDCTAEMEPESFTQRSQIVLRKGIANRIPPFNYYSM